MHTISPDSRRFVLDSWAWFEYFAGSPAGRKVSEILNDSRNEIFVNPVIVAEVWSRARRRGLDAAAMVASMEAAVTVPLDREAGKGAGETHALKRKTDPDYPLADAFVLEMARKVGAKVVTGDPHFRGAKDVVFLGK